MRRAVYDVAALIARVVVGVVFAVHGWMKFDTGWDGVTRSFAESGVLLPRLAAGYATVVEFGGGLLLIAGLLTPLTGLLLAVNMLGAYVFVHAGQGVLVDEGGFELVGALGSTALLLAAAGAGRISLDHLLFGLFHGRHRGGEAAPL